MSRTTVHAKNPRGRGKRGNIHNLTKLYRKLYFSGDARARQVFNKFFERAQKVYREAFPKDEREHGNVVRGYMRGVAKGEHEDAYFLYLSYVVGANIAKGDAGRSLGMYSGDVIPVEALNGSILFHGYVATSKKARRQGIGRALITKAISVASEHAESVGKPLVYHFGEVEQPKFAEYERVLNGNANGDEVMRNVIRPNFHQKVTGL